MSRTGALLLQLGTPDSPTPRDVRRYLREFLSDPRVLDMPAPARALLLYGVILPFRPRRSAAAYQQIWTDAGSPLLTNSRALVTAVQERLGSEVPVVLGMRYGQPDIAGAVDALEAAGAERIVALPLFPQYASSSSGSALECLQGELGRRWNVPALTTLPAFFDRPDFLDSVAAVARGPLRGFGADHVLLSYHGLPERQIRRSDASGTHCLAREDCCESPGAALANCYRAQCFATSRGLVERLGLAPGAWSNAFQSRLGRTPWIQPFTDLVLPELAERGVKRLAVLCPSFVADCLETLEEIGIRAAEQWRELGGEALLAVPCVNADAAFADFVAGQIRSAIPS